MREGQPHAFLERDLRLTDLRRRAAFQRDRLPASGADTLEPRTALASATSPSPRRAARTPTPTAIPASRGRAPTRVITSRQGEAADLRRVQRIDASLLLICEPRGSVERASRVDEPAIFRREPHHRASVRQPLFRLLHAQRDQIARLDAASDSSRNLRVREALACRRRAAPSSRATPRARRLSLKAAQDAASISAGEDHGLKHEPRHRLQRHHRARSAATGTAAARSRSRNRDADERLPGRLMRAGHAPQLEGLAQRPPHEEPVTMKPRPTSAAMPSIVSPVRPINR